MNSSSQIIPKEILKFRLDKQLGKLKQVIEVANINSEEEDKFQLYQRILSWFIMGRLAKSEYDMILENILITTELIGNIIGREKCEFLIFLILIFYHSSYNNYTELHNRIIELLRAIYCDSSSNSVTNEINPNSNSSLDYFLNSFEFNLLPETANEKKKDGGEDEEENLITNYYTEDLIYDNTHDLDDTVAPQFIVINSNLKTCKFNTSIENLGLTSSEEALISEAMRNPIHDIASFERDVLIPGINYRKGFDINFDCGNRSCTEIKSLPDQNLMKSRFLKVSSTLVNENSSTPTISDSIAILACKSLEDYMKNLLDNVAAIKFGHQPLLRAPISYIFPNVSDDQNETIIGDKLRVNEVTEKDLNLLFKLKPWLLGDMESDLLIELFK